MVDTTTDEDEDNITININNLTITSHHHHQTLSPGKALRAERMIGAFASERKMRKLPLLPAETFQKMLTMMMVVVVNMMIMVMVIMMLIISIMGRSPANSNKSLLLAVATAELRL